MSKLPYFKFYPQDFLVGTSFMTPSEVGGYIRLLCVSWEKGGIPRDNKIVSRITGCDTEENLNILDKFIVIDDLFVNERLEEVRKELELFSNKQSDRAKKRWDATAMPRDATAMPSQKSEVISQNTEVNKENTCAEKSARYITIQFDLLWSKYPQDRRRGKEKCKKIYNRECVDFKTEDLFLSAFSKYSQSKDYQNGFIKTSDNWFKDWRTWLDFEVEERFKIKEYW